jgi:hypothetical protein
MHPHHSTPTPTIGVSVKEAVRITSISDKELRDAVNRGDIPARRIGRRIAIDYAGLVAWFNSHDPVVDKSA